MSELLVSRNQGRSTVSVIVDPQLATSWPMRRSAASAPSGPRSVLRSVSTSSGTTRKKEGRNERLVRLGSDRPTGGDWRPAEGLLRRRRRARAQAAGRLQAARAADQRGRASPSGGPLARGAGSAGGLVAVTGSALESWASRPWTLHACTRG